MDYRENGQIDKEADSDPNAEVIRTAGGNADNVIPTLKRIVEEAKKNGDKVEVDVKLHTDCGAGKYSFSVLTQGIKAEPIIAKHIISRYNEWSVNRVEDMWSNNSAELHNRMLNNAFAKEIAEGVLKVKVGVDKTEEFNVPKEKREVRLIVSKTKRGVSYEEINGKLGFGAYAYYLHADSINEILPDILLAHMELKIVDIRFLSFSKEEDGQMEDWMSALGKDKHAKAAVITPERAHIFMRSESIPAE
ncbi:MAG TPA: hypothetical protein VND15_01750 [Candidatus Acidoferrales bacterium]|nr:hypothetical protein [Candidatus Acidoferrales bacterium]